MLSYLVQPGATVVATVVVDATVAGSGPGVEASAPGTAADGDGLGWRCNAVTGTGAGVGVPALHAASDRIKKANSRIKRFLTITILF